MGEKGERETGGDRENQTQAGGTESQPASQSARREGVELWSPKSPGMREGLSHQEQQLSH